METVKYLRFKRRKPEFGIFPSWVAHNEMLKKLEYCLYGMGKNKADVMSAGFVDGMTCYGKSDSLGIASQESDTLALKQFLGLEPLPYE